MFFNQKTLILKQIVFIALFFNSVFSASSQTYRIDTLNGQTINTCSGTFYDSGGPGAFYSDNENDTVTFCSDNGQPISLNFTTFEVRIGDTLWIYDGPDTGSPLLGGYTGEGATFNVTSSGTCLTFVFISDPNFNRAGWVGDISCGACFPPPITPISPQDTNVCVNETVTYSVDNHSGSTYSWTVFNGTPATFSGSNTLDVTWSNTGGISGSVKVVETNDCGASDSSELVVDIHDLPVVSFSGLLADYCIDDSPDTLTPSPTGGIFAGPGMTDSIFYPSVAGTGTHNITYTYTDTTTGCSNQDIQTTDVHPLPTVTMSGLDTLYDVNDAAVTMTGTPAGGIFSGPGVSGDTFDPAVAGVGIHQVIYTYTDAFGCSNADTVITEVRDYDFKAGARLIPDINNWCSANARYSTIGATADENQGACWNTGPNFNRWFKFQATTTQVNVQVKTGGDEGTMQYPYVAVWTETGTQVACARYSGQYSDLQAGSVGLVPGDWYYISVDNYNNTGYRGTFTLCVDDSVNYDFKAGALELTDFNNWCSADAAYSTLNGSPDELKGSCWNTGPNFNVWFKFRATSSTMIIDLKTGGTEGTLRYPYITLWDSVNTEIACARYASQYSDLTVGSTSLVPGNWYYISIDNYNNTAYRGTFTLCLDNTVDYDFREGALEVPDTGVWCSADAAYTTINASADGVKGSCWNTGPNYNRWFKFQATTDQVLVRLKTGGSEGSMRYPYVVLQDSVGNELACARYSGQYSDLSIGADGLAPGDWYYIAVDNYANSAYRGTFTLCVSDSIDYDYKAGAIELTDLNNWCSADAAYTTLNASADELKGSCWNTGPNYNRWFKFQATTSMVTVQVKTGGAEGSMRYPYVALWDDSNNELACGRYTGAYSDLTVGSNALTPGQWYYISVDNYASTAYRGSFTLCVNDTIDYDFKDGAIELTDLNYWCSPDAAYTTMDASADESKGSCWNTGPNYNRWFKFQATKPFVKIDLKTGGSEGSMRYPYIALWDDALSEIACARYSATYSDLTLGNTSLVPGNWYYISVDNYANVAYRGTFTLCITDTIDYDWKDAAIVLNNINNWCSADAEYTTVNATPDEIKGSCWNTGPNFNRWFKFQATTNKVTAQIKTGGSEGSLRYPYIALFDTGLNELACARYVGAYDDLKIGSVNLTPGDWYYIAIDNYNNTAYRGTFTLCVDDTVDYDFKDGAYEILNYNNYCSSLQQFSTVGASPDESAGSCWPNGPNYNRWFKFQATGTDVTVQVKTGDTEGTLRYPMVALWDNALTELACARYADSYTDLEVTYSGLTPGNWYYVSVDNYAGTGYRGTFTLCMDDQISYDYKAGAIVLSDVNGWCSSDAAYETINATPDESAGSCWPNGPNYNRWFTFQAPTSAISIMVRTTDIEGTLRRPMAALWDNALTEITCKSYVSDNGDIELWTTGLTPGAWYFISVDNSTGTGYRGTFTLCVTDAIANDDKTNATELADLNGWCSEDAEYTNSIATMDDVAGSCWTDIAGTGLKNVWYKFQATSNQATVSVTTGGDNGEMRKQQIAAWNTSGVETGCTGPLATGTGTQSLLLDTLTSGNWYWVAVDDDSISGTFTLCIDDNLVYPFPPGATVLTDLNNWCSAPHAFTNVGAPADTKSGSCWTGATYNNKWFKFQATTSEIKVQVRTGADYGTMNRQQLALWNSTGTEVACAKWIYNTGTVPMQMDSLTPGNWYWISVDDDYTSGDFQLCINDQVDYDFKSRAVELTDLNNWCSTDAGYGNLFATPDQLPGSCFTDGQGTGLKNVWFKFQATTSFIKIQVKTGNVYGSMQRQQVALWNEAGVEVGCAKWIYNQGTIVLQIDTLTAGNWYYISVDDDRVSGTFSLCINDQPDYDFRAGAVELTDLNDWCSGDAVYSNLFATPDEVAGSCFTDGQGTGLKNVWFKFQATTSFIKIRVKTGNVYGSMQRQQVALWNEAGVEVECTKWVYNQGTITLQTDTLIPGNWYYISVDDVSGTFTLCANDQVDYDYKLGAIELTDLNDWCSTDAAYSNLFATPDEVAGSCFTDGQGTGLKNVWFKFQATTSFIKIRVKTGNVYGSMQRQQVALWNEAGVEVGCTKWVYNQGTITLQTDTLIPGNWYYISVDDVAPLHYVPMIR